MYELALAGIGGNTVDTVKANLTEHEILQWMAYRERRGSLNVGRRVEQSMGNLMAFYHNGKVPKDKWVEPLELMPHEDDVEMSLEDMLVDID